MKQNIFKAIMSNDIAAVKELVGNNRDSVKETDQMGRTPLMEAAIQHNKEICKILLDAGANVNAREIRNWTALHFASQEYDADIVSMLLDNGADIDAEDSDGNTPLFRCLFNSKGRGEVIKLLLHNGANKDHQNNSGVSPWALAQQITNFNLKQHFAK